MKCKLLFGLFAVGLGCSVVAQDTPVTYENPGLLLVPPSIAPQIDAANFVNAGRFIINFTNSYVPILPIYGLPPFETFNTLNFTNTFGSFMSCNAGFRFEYFNPDIGKRQPASSYFNAGTINCGTLDTTNFLIFDPQPFGSGGLAFTTFYTTAGSKFVVSANDIKNPGTNNMGFDSVLTFTGDSIDLTRASIASEKTGFSLFDTNLFFSAGIFDGAWGVSTNVISPSGQFPPNNVPPTTPVFAATTRSYSTVVKSLTLTNSVSYLQDVTDASGSNRFIKVVFLSNTNAEIGANVYFFPAGFADIVVEYTNLLGTVSNNLYVFDSFGVRTNDRLLINGFAGTRSTFIPENYFVFRNFPLFLGTPEVPSVIPFGIFNGRVVTNQYSYYQALLQPLSLVLGDVFGQDITNSPGRMNFTANNYLNLSHTFISCLNYLSLKATNHFSNQGFSQIASPFIDFNLRSTNGFLSISNLLAPTFDRPEGTIDLWATRWTNIINGITNQYHVLFVDSRFSGTAPSRAQDFILRTTNFVDSTDEIVLSDAIEVTRNFLLDTVRLTVTTNAPGSLASNGGLTISDPRIVWSSSTPRLQFLTNNGFINAANTMFFGGSRRSPYFSTDFNEAYVAFANTGGVTNFASRIWANTFVNGGVFQANGAAVQLERSRTAVLTNGMFIAPQGDIFIASGDLTISNHTLLAGAAITFVVTNILDDGSLVSRVDEFFTNKNFWAVGNGIHLPIMPAHASLLATTITNTDLSFANVINTWSGNDLGCVPAGFVDNAAIGHLILDGRARDSVFTFAPASAKNAIYIDHLDLRNFATNIDASGHFLGVQIDPNMTVYFAQATAGGLSIAEKLNGSYGATGPSGGRFCWVSTYNCGFFSSTNFTYPDGSIHQINTALAQSCDLDSNGNGIVNCLDNAPLPLPLAPCGEPPFPGGNGLDRLGLAGNGPTFSPAGVPTLGFPSSRSFGVGGALSNGLALATGAYNGLFYDTNGVAAGSAGYFSAKTTARGAYTARILLSGRTYSFSGNFDAATGQAAKSVKRLGLSPLTVRLQLDLAGGDQIRGTVSDGQWAATLLADRLVFNPASKKATLKGNYTVVIPSASEASSSPAGHGFGTAKVDAGGNVLLAGTLADGTKAAQKSAVSKDGIWPLYASLYGGRGAVLSWMQFTNQTTSDVDGQVVWIKPVGVAGKYYPMGFTNAVGAIGSLHSATVPATKALPASGRELTFSDGGLTDDLSFPISLGANNKVTNLGSNKLTLTITASSGLFKGVAFNPETRKSLPFQGVLLDKMNVGAGFFLGTNQSGRVYLGSPVQ